MAINFLIFKLSLTESDVLKLNLISGKLIDVSFSIPRYHHAALAEIRQMISTTNFTLSSMSRKYLRGCSITTCFELQVAVLKLSTVIALMQSIGNYDFKGQVCELEEVIKGLTDIIMAHYEVHRLPELKFGE